MAWEHKMAREIKSRDNPKLPTIFSGIVVNVSPLTVSAFDGAAMLQYPQLQRVDPWMQCTAYKGCTPKDGATCHYDGGKAMGNCAGCNQGKCLELRPLQVGQKVLLAGGQTYYILGVVQ